MLKKKCKGEISDKTEKEWVRMKGDFDRREEGEMVQKWEGEGEKLLPLNTVRVKTKELDGEEMRYGESTGSNLWFDFGSPWLSVRCQEGFCASLRALPAALINLLRP